MTTAATTVADIKLYAGITDANKDALYASLIPSSLKGIGAFCNRDFASSDRVEYRDGNGSARMMLANYPILSIASLTIDGIKIPASDGVSPGYWFPPNGRALMLRGYKFAQGLRNVAIQLSAGYGDASGPGGTDIIPWPDDLQMALNMYIITRANERSRLGIGSKSLASESVTFTDGPSGTSSGSKGIPSAAKDILENYLNTIPESGQ
jgi:hypothetical protein